MLANILTAVERVLDKRLWHIEDRIQTHHNYVNLEQHYGDKRMVHRKGAVKAQGQVIIPGSMGTASYIGNGLDFPDSFGTCAHGAGRIMSRSEAKRSITHAEAVEAMKDVVFGVRQGDYDEMPQAYKDIHAVMGNQADLVEAVDLLHPLAVVKG